MLWMCRGGKLNSAWKSQGVLLRGVDNFPEPSRKSIPCGQEERGIQGREVIIKAQRNDCAFKNEWCIQKGSGLLEWRVHVEVKFIRAKWQGGPNKEWRFDCESHEKVSCSFAWNIFLCPLLLFQMLFVFLCLWQLVTFLDLGAMVLCKRCPMHPGNALPTHHPSWRLSGFPLPGLQWGSLSCGRLCMLVVWQAWSPLRLLVARPSLMWMLLVAGQRGLVTRWWVAKSCHTPPPGWCWLTGGQSQGPKASGALACEATSWVSPCPWAGRAGSWSLAARSGITEFLSGWWMVGVELGGSSWHSCVWGPGHHHR